MNLEIIKNLIFDLDGTLIDSSAGVIEATNYGLRSIGEPERTGPEIRRFIGYPLEDMFRAFSTGSYTEFWKYFQERAKETVVAAAVPINGADEVVRELSKRGYKMAIGTTKIRIHIEKILRKHDWQDIFHIYAGADDVGKVKPNPEVFIRLLKEMSANPHDTLVIGDTVNDVYAAKAASLKILAVRSPYGSDGELEASSPDKIIGDLTDLLPILK
ncbi:MAG: HAD family hydrolase [Candidatus Zixiibacteriota bacterium]